MIEPIARVGIAAESHLGSPAGEVHYTPALEPPRPALKLLLETLPQPLRSRVRIGARSQLAAGSRPADPQTVLPTAQPALDTLLCGGLPRGALCELDGRFSSGRFSLVLAVLAAATGVGEAAALIDLGDSLDPRAAATAGVDLKRLLWVRPRRTQEALMAAEAVLGSGFPCVVVDLGLPPLAGGKGQEGHWLRLARAARDQEASVLVSSPYRLTGPAATVVLAAERAQARWCGPQPWLAELGVGLSLCRHRGRAPGGQARLRWQAMAGTTATLDEPSLLPVRQPAPVVANRPGVARLRRQPRTTVGWRPRGNAGVALAAVAAGG